MSGEMPDWERIKSIMNLRKFPVVVECEQEEFRVLQQVYPLMQPDIYKIMKCKDLKDAVIILFGSALTMRCNSFSDLDIAVKTRELDYELFHAIQARIASLVNVECDIIYLNDMNNTEPIINEIQKGLIIKR